jgi:hypothetical protein
MLRLYSLFGLWKQAHQNKKNKKQTEKLPQDEREKTEANLISATIQKDKKWIS